MTDITLPRTELEQALKALGIVRLHYAQNQTVNVAFSALRERLSQPEQEPLQFKCTIVDDAHLKGVPLSQWGKQPEQEPAPVQQEPAIHASIRRTSMGGLVGNVYWVNDRLAEGYYTLYTSPPPQRKPLTHDLYNELLFAVETKCPDETRHQTALRYIKQAEMPSARPAQAAHGIKGEA